MKTTGSGTEAFSLVEITLTLGIAAFCLITVFGLLPVGITTHKTALEQTVANGILSAVISDLRNTPRTIPRGQAAFTPQFAIHIPANPVGTATGDILLYFADSGEQLASAEAARYRVTVSFCANGSAAKTATFVRLRASWPASLEAASATGVMETFCALDRN